MLTRVFLLLSATLFISSSFGSEIGESGIKLISERNFSGKDQENPKPESSGKRKVSSGSSRFIGQWVQVANASALSFLPNINPGANTPGTGATGAAGSGTSSGIFESIFGGGGGLNNNNFGLPGTVGTVGASAVLVSSEPKLGSVIKSFKRRTVAIKGGFLTLLSAVKTVVVPAVVVLLLIVFLLAGAAFFTCSLVDCQGGLGPLTRGGGLSSAIGGSSLLDDRNAIDYYEQFRPVFQGIEEGNHKYGTPLKGLGKSPPPHPGQ